MVYPATEETFDTRATPEWIKEGHLNSIQALLKRIQDFIGYGGRLHDEAGLVMPVGSIVMYVGATAPSGWLLCDGKEYDSTASAYIDLFNVIGNFYGSRGGSEFNVPDLRGMFVRGLSKCLSAAFVPADVHLANNTIDIAGHAFNRGGFPVRVYSDDTLPVPLVINTTYYIIIHDSGLVSLATTRALSLTRTAIDITTQGVGFHTLSPYIEAEADSRLESTEGSNTGNNKGTYQIDSTKLPNSEFITGNESNSIYGYSGTQKVDDPSSAYQIGEGSHHHHVTSGGDIETRPKNVNVNYIIKL